MSPKEKVKELFNKFYPEQNIDAYSIRDNRKFIDYTKRCMIICVDEIISQWEYIDTYIADDGGKLNPNLKYWIEVKQEIEKL